MIRLCLATTRAADRSVDRRCFGPPPWTGNRTATPRRTDSDHAECPGKEAFKWVSCLCVFIRWVIIKDVSVSWDMAIDWHCKVMWWHDDLLQRRPRLTFRPVITCCSPTRTCCSWRSVRFGNDWWPSHRLATAISQAMAVRLACRWRVTVALAVLRRGTARSLLHRLAPVVMATD